MATILVSVFASPAFSVGFHYGSIPDDTGRPIEIGIWYPSTSTPTPTTVGMVSQTVALDGVVDGDRLPVVIFSHGNGGWYGDRSDMATLFAEHGLVAVSLTYPGDNDKDTSDRLRRQLTSRPIVTSQVIDYVLDTWSGRDHLDASKVGFYGFSAGGYTGLVELGGVPDWTLFARHCAEYPAEMICQQGGARYLSSPQAAAIPSSAWHHDPRIKAAVLAAPGYGFAFDPTSLQRIDVPVELWGGADDDHVPFESNLVYLNEHMPHIVALHRVSNAGHFSFLRPCSEAVKAKHLDTCTDRPGFDRAAFQNDLDRDLLRFFRSEFTISR